MEGIFDRAELLLGKGALEKLQDTRVILFGVGGVGSWCAESLIRTGLGHLTIVDDDVVAVTNVNRQLMATTKSVGEVKVEAMKARLLEINPAAEITAIRTRYSEDTNDVFHLGEYDYVIDCIDSLKDKVSLLVNATNAHRPVVFSSMGAALKIDSTKIGVAEFWKVHGCPLGAALRNRIRHEHLKLGSKVRCVFSPEVLENKGSREFLGGANNPKGPRCPNGSLVHITAIFGNTLAGLVIKDIFSESR